MGYTIFPDGALGEATEDAYREVQRAKDKHGNTNFNSIHEGWGVLEEEVDELWEEIKKSKPSKELIRKEAIQVAAMALRIASELDHTINFKRDRRYELIKERFETLSSNQLQRMKDKIDITIFDEYNYKDGKYCPMAIALSLDVIPNPSQDSIEAGIGVIYQPSNMLKGVKGKFYHGTDEERKKDLLSLIDEILKSRKNDTFKKNY